MKRIKLRCPICMKFFKFKYKLKEVEGCTFDCKHCDGLLLINDAKIVDFHAQLHKEDSRWPKDGKDAKCLILSGEIHGTT